LAFRGPPTPCVVRPIPTKAMKTQGPRKILEVKNAQPPQCFGRHTLAQQILHLPPLTEVHHAHNMPFVTLLYTP
jgi:hypothetical protein